ncbi:hypothetical protein VTJ49DRAFT_5334 [Mycothermus thermophilus]|uniref:Kinetochore protein fta4 n=1 Tax=Humicola insolens TaxID=85995 RepID=A0ABR3V3D1_HUMIN
MAPNPPTILTLKQSFLTAQTRLLSQPLSPSPAWLDDNKNNNDPDNPPLPEKAVHDALFKLNHRLQQHARRVYPPQATRHVAEQIDQLYWNAAEAVVGGGESEGEGEEDIEALSLGADLTNPSTITTLPPTWDSDSVNTNPVAREQYASLASTLHSLAERKQQAAARVARLRRMRALLEPFSPAPASGSASSSAAAEPSTSASGMDFDVDVDRDADPDGLKTVQENLVTRNGALEKELLRMRVLLARVSGRAELLKEQQQQSSRGRKRGRDGDQAGRTESPSSAGSLFSERPGAGAVEDVEVEERRKVGALLESF